MERKVAWSENPLVDAKFDSKSDSLRIPYSAKDEKDTVESSEKNKKIHFAGTPEGSFLARLNAHVYRKIIASKKEGGLKEWFEDNCDSFHWDNANLLISSGEADYTLEQYDLFKVYEKELDTALNEFCEKERIEKKDMMQRVHSAIDRFGEEAEKLMEMTLAASDFRKFIKLMRIKWKVKQKKLKALAAAKELTANVEGETNNAANTNTNTNDSEPKKCSSMEASAK